MWVLVGAMSAVAAHASTPKGNPEAGAQKNAMCIGCHGIVGFKTGFPEVYRIPKIYGLNAYKSGERSHPSMRAIAESLTDQDMADLGAYFESAAGDAPISVVPWSRDATLGKSLLAQGGCQACHGENFSTPLDGSYPKLAGQNGDYLYVALRAYKASANPRKQQWIGRTNPVMAAMASQFSDEQLRAMANYLAGLPGSLATVQRSGLN
jgi:cytochrome c553